MSLRQLPAVQALARPEGVTWDAPAGALARWSPGIQAADAEDTASISIYDFIGEDPWSGGGWTAKRVAGLLRTFGDRAVAVSINSPGGDVFEGIAIYNLLREHKAAVNVRVMGLAASAASLIAMAGDEILMGEGAMLMVHNAWGVALGNRHDLRAAADVLEPIDDAMAGIYAARSGQDRKKVGKMLDDETWMSSAQAVEKGFADGVLAGGSPAQASAKLDAPMQARHQLDIVLAKAGMPRSQRRNLLRDLASGTPSAAVDPATHDAGLSGAAAELRRLINTLTP
ncbi:MAG: peptidase [Rubritepida sp.]|nr:peptidase [Rubritepida sp.]